MCLRGHAVYGSAHFWAPEYGDGSFLRNFWCDRSVKGTEPGALTLLITFNAAILLMMSPVMFINNFGSVLVVELLILLIFRSYESDKAIILAPAW